MKRLFAALLVAVLVHALSNTAMRGAGARLHSTSGGENKQTSDVPPGRCRI